MSVPVEAWAWKQKVGSPLRKLILVKLAQNADDDGWSWWRQSRIAEECETTRQTVNEHIAKLRGMGLIQVIEQKRDDGGRRSNKYRVLGPWVEGNGDPEQEAEVIVRQAAAVRAATWKPSPKMVRLAKRDGWGCHYCKVALISSADQLVPQDDGGFTCIQGFEFPSIEHVVPRSEGGAETDDNLVLACLRCNIGKGTKPLDVWLRSVSEADVAVVVDDVPPVVENDSKKRPEKEASKGKNPPTPLGQRRFRVESNSDPGKTYVADLKAGRCTCQAKTGCRHLSEAEEFEERASTESRKEMRDALWDVLVEIDGPPVQRKEAERGQLVADLAEMMVNEGIKATPERWTEEVKARHKALVKEWGISRVTLHSFITNWNLAGRLVRGSGNNVEREDRRYATD